MDNKQKIFYATLLVSTFAIGIVSINTIKNNGSLLDTMKYLAKTINSSSRTSSSSSSGSPSPSPSPSPCPGSGNKSFDRKVDNPLNDPQLQNDISNKINQIKNDESRRVVEDALNRMKANFDNIIKEQLCGCVSPDDIDKNLANILGQIDLDTIVDAANQYSHYIFMNGIKFVKPGFKQEALDPLEKDEQKYKANPPKCDRSNKQF